MTRKDHVKIAEIIRNRSYFADRVALAREFAFMLREDNSRFDRDKFMEDCGIK